MNWKLWSHINNTNCRYFETKAVKIILNKRCKGALCMIVFALIGKMWNWWTCWWWLSCLCICWTIWKRIFGDIFPLHLLYNICDSIQRLDTISFGKQLVQLIYLFNVNVFNICFAGSFAGGNLITVYGMGFDNTSVVTVCNATCEHGRDIRGTFVSYNNITCLISGNLNFVETVLILAKRWTGRPVLNLQNMTYTCAYVFLLCHILHYGLLW